MDHTTNLPPAPCPHVACVVNGEPLTKIDSSAFKKNVANSTLTCDGSGCSSRIPKVWLCLNSKCRTVVCSTNKVSHMRIHFETHHGDPSASLNNQAQGDNCHCVFVNPRSLTFWCYSCGREIRAFAGANDEDIPTGDSENSTQVVTADGPDGLVSAAEARLYLRKVLRCLQGKRNGRNSIPVVDACQADGPISGRVGLKNLGNTCYMSAALQALSNTPALTNYFQYCDAFTQQKVGGCYGNRKTGHCLSEPFGQWVRCMWSGRSAIFAPVRLANEFRSYNEAFQGYGQQDSQEFLRSLLDKLHEELPYPRSSIEPEEDAASLRPSVDSTNSSRSPTPLESNRKELQGGNDNNDMVEITRLKKTPRSIISDIFEGVMESTVQCAECKKSYVKEDRFYDLSIQIDKKNRLAGDEIVAKERPSGFLGSMAGLGGWLGLGGRSVKLQDCLASFCATESLTGDDRYLCTRCKKLNDCQKTLRITRLPDTLTIQLKRFRYDSYFSSKIGTHVQFPMEDLDMRPFCKSAGDLDLTKYDLYALIHHRGGLGGGHYIGYAKNPLDNNWYEFDDTYVTRKTEVEVSRSEAYVLFYRRKPSRRREDERRSILAELLASSVPLFSETRTAGEKNKHRPASLRKGGLELKTEDRNIEQEQEQDRSNRLMWVSRLWFNRWMHLSEPGPITNFDFLCSHGAMTVRDKSHAEATIQKLPPHVYAHLVEEYGTDGSPPFGDDRAHEEACRDCAEAEEILEARRKREEKDILLIDSSSLGDGQLWYLISSEWLKAWHAFKSGGPDPGPIRNTHFLHTDGKPRKRMKRGADYRGVNRMVWEYFYGTYGGGPICVRDQLDLYAPPIPYPTERINLEKELAAARISGRSQDKSTDEDHVVKEDAAEEKGERGNECDVQVPSTDPIENKGT